MTGVGDAGAAVLARLVAVRDEIRRLRGEERRLRDSALDVLGSGGRWSGRGDGGQEVVVSVERAPRVWDADVLEARYPGLWGRARRRAVDVSRLRSVCVVEGVDFDVVAEECSELGEVRVAVRDVRSRAGGRPG